MSDEINKSNNEAGSVTGHSAPAHAAGVSGVAGGTGGAAGFAPRSSGFGAGSGAGAAGAGRHLSHAGNGVYGAHGVQGGAHGAHGPHGPHAAHGSHGTHGSHGGHAGHGGHGSYGRPAGHDSHSEGEAVKKGPNIKDASIDGEDVGTVDSSMEKKVRGMATIESTLNSMTGDISYEELAKVPGISTMALKAKENVGDVSIFQKKDYVSSISSCPISDISYQNIPLLSKFISANGRIVPSRISAVSYAAQKQLERAIKTARFLGLLPYVEY